MSRAKELLKNTGILMIAKISTQFVSFLLLPLYTALLSTSQYGIIDIYTSLVMIIVPILTLQLEMGLFRFFVTEKSGLSKRKLVTTSFVTIGFLLVFASIVYVVFICLVKVDYPILVYLYYFTITIMTVLLQVSRAYGKNVIYGFASFLGSALSVVLNVVFIAYLRMRVDGILLSSIIAQSVACIYMLCRLKLFGILRLKYYDKKVKSKLLNYSIPLVFNQISSWAINYSDRIIILSVWGTAYNGIYSLANKFSNIVNTFYGVFNVAWTENVVRSMNDDNASSYINKMFKFIYNIYFVIVTGIINFLPIVFKILVKSNYDDAYGHIPILLLAMLFSGMAATIGSIYIAYNKTKDVSITTILSGICNVVVHISLLKTCGLYAASISTLVSFCALFIYRLHFVKRFFDLRFSYKFLIPQLLIYVFSWYAYSSRSWVEICIGIIMNLTFGFIMIFKGKDVIKTILKK